MGSRRFWVTVGDVVISLLLYFVGKYFSVALDDVKMLITTLQPLFLLVVAAYTVEDSVLAFRGVPK